MQLSWCIQLLRERLSEKVHATLPKGIVGGFEGTVLQRNLKEWYGRPRTCLRVLKESNKSRFDSFSRYEQCIDHIPYYLSGLSRAHFFRQPFSKQLYTKTELSADLKTRIKIFGFKRKMQQEKKYSSLKIMSKRLLFHSFIISRLLLWSLN